MVGEPDSYTLVYGFDPFQWIQRNSGEKAFVQVWFSDLVFPALLKVYHGLMGGIFKEFYYYWLISAFKGNIKTVYACVDGIEVCNASTGSILYRENQEAVLVYGLADYFDWREYNNLVNRYNHWSNSTSTTCGSV